MPDSGFDPTPMAWCFLALPLRHLNGAGTGKFTKRYLYHLGTTILLGTFAHKWCSHDSDVGWGASFRILPNFLYICHRVLSLCYTLQSKNGTILFLFPNYLISSLHRDLKVQGGGGKFNNLKRSFFFLQYNFHRN